jgi:hypothetical protein
LTPPLPPKNKFLNNYTLPTEANLMGNQSPSLLLSQKKKGDFMQPKHFLKPSLIESRVAESPDTFNQLGEGFKKLFLDNNASS